uniref:G-protein coupled receptors family 1 profile domain-containing protein n=1 Tax=Pyxicephalus adspersus TaxID=30357 RepID=A0AAV3B4F6_PYXAD|nr:TPA: hypothetical protein GDO54_005828 [Pyxicephalus adspersus]
MTNIKTICLLGFKTPQNIKLFLFFFFLLIYCVAICGNLLIITLVFYSKSLYTPMYFFLTQLSLSDILLINDTLPGMLKTVLVKERVVSLSLCISQFYFFAVSLTVESLLLTAMSYDRYLAICKPFHYSSTMTYKLCWILIDISWTLSFLVVLIHTLSMSKLQFCGRNIIDHFFCDLATILDIPSIIGRQKAFSTCSSHLTVVSIYFGTLACVYLVPSKGPSWNISKYLSLLYTAATPLMNPIIYTLRNKTFKNVLAKCFILWGN